MSVLDDVVADQIRTDLPDLTPGVLNKLTAQAKIQVRQRQTGIPQFEVVDPQPLTLLPEPDPGDLHRAWAGGARVFLLTPR